MADAEQRSDIGMAPGLRENSLVAIDEDDGEIGCRSAGYHVAGIFLVARRVGNDEFALRRGEIAVGDVDGDALLALGLEPVEQQSKVDFLAIGAGRSTDPAEIRQLVLEDQLGIDEQTADQRRLAIVDGAAGDEAQHRLAVVIGEMRRQVVWRH